MPRVVFALLCTALVSSAALAQDSTAYVRKEPEKKTLPFKDRIWFGGGIGLNFGTVTAIQLNPLLGYYLDNHRKISVGLGPSYSYYRDNRYIPAYEQSIYGYRLFTRYRVIEQAFLAADFLQLNTQPFYNFDDQKGRIWVPHLLLGAGYVQPLAGRTSVYLQVMFEVLQDPNSVYGGQGPIFSGGIGVGF